MYKSFKVMVQWTAIELMLKSGVINVPGFNRRFDVNRVTRNAVKWTDGHGRSAITYCADKGKLKMHYAFMIKLHGKYGLGMVKLGRPAIYSTVESMEDARKEFPGKLAVADNN